MHFPSTMSSLVAFRQAAVSELTPPAPSPTCDMEGVIFRDDAKVTRALDHYQFLDCALPHWEATTDQEVV